jgi:hypothetical protein
VELFQNVEGIDQIGLRVFVAPHGHKATPQGAHCMRSFSSQRCSVATLQYADGPFVGIARDFELAALELHVSEQSERATE